MADLKISALPASTTPLAGTEVLPIVQSSATKQVSIANLTAGRTQTSNGIVQGTAGTGYNFTANTPAAGMTSQLLNWYEEGTWTPSQGSGLTVVGTFASSGKYTRIGRQVTIQAQYTGSTSISCSAVGVLSNNMPYSSGTTIFSGSVFSENPTQGGLCVSSDVVLYSVNTISTATKIVVTTTIFV